MSDEKIAHVIENFSKQTGVIYKYFIIISIGLLICFASLTVMKYRSTFLEIILHPKDFVAKSIIKDKIPAVESENMSIDLNGNSLNISIFAKKVIPHENSTELLNISSKAKATKNNSEYTITAKSGDITADKIFTLKNGIEVSDIAGNNVRFAELIYTANANIVNGLSPVFSGVNNKYKYNITANNLSYYPLSSLVKLIDNVKIIAINEEAKTKTVATSEFVDISSENNEIIMKKDVNIRHMNYIIDGDVAIIKIVAENKHKTQANSMFSSDVKEVKIQGNVRMKDGGMDISSETANYTAENNEIVFTENVNIKDKMKNMKAHRVIYNTATKQAKIEPKHTTKSVLSRNSDSKIEIVFD